LPVFHRGVIDHPSDRYCEVIPIPKALAFIFFVILCFLEMRSIVRTEVLETALRGGGPARELSVVCADRRRVAEAALNEALADAPQIIADSRARSEYLERETEILCGELDALSRSVDDLVGTSMAVAQDAIMARSKQSALEDLALLLKPFVAVAKAIEAAETPELQNVSQLHGSLLGIENATRLCTESDNAQLRNLLPKLQDIATEVMTMMQFRFLDMVSISESRVVVRQRQERKEVIRSSPLSMTTTPSDALASAGLLDEALRAIVGKLRSSRVADGLRSATVFISRIAVDDAEQFLQWSADDDGDGELLEFDFDDIEEVPEWDIDAMTSALDISNAASRSVALFDLLRDNVVGEKHSAALAAALQPWLVNDVLPASAVLSVQRPMYSDTGVPADALRSRVLATSASARVLQTALCARGADPASFVINIDVSDIERAVGDECRGQTVLRARRAIGTFADARRDSAQMIACPLATHEYVLPAEQTLDYFPPCIVSRAAAVVLDVFSSTRTDALHALAGGSTAIGDALLAAACECVDAYRVDVPLQHGDDMRTSLRLKVLYYNDCMMLKHACQQAAIMDQHVPQGENGTESQAGKSDDNIRLKSSSEMAVVASRLGKAAETVMANIRHAAEKGLVDNLKAASRNGALGSSGTLTRIQRSSALAAAYNSMRELVEVFADLVPTELGERAAASLCCQYLQSLCDGVSALDDIMPDACQQIDGILEDAGEKVRILMQNFAGMNDLRQGAPPPDIVSQLAVSQRRANAYRHVLTARMEEIVSSYKDGRYEGLLDKSAVEALLLKIFEDTPLRSTFISELDVNKETEEKEWGAW
jgi:hypothetical protein